MFEVDAFNVFKRLSGTGMDRISEQIRISLIGIKGIRMTDDHVKKLGYVASVMSVVMYVSYIAQIYNNLHGVKGNFLQPLAACLNCILWTIYAFKSKPKNIPLLIANLPGILLAAITVATSF
ncbi:SemiSWEET family transporter [Allobaculum sp. JKK-2023]|uniref:SemiSWEET family transporter n=1 Tax=Allobaculum sp. JKK-2023 TaxID=3108943 RepID=UPI002B0572E0|nr:SemiSWEET family transporter [Allobaculum sp. JKK-2023]